MKIIRKIGKYFLWFNVVIIILLICLYFFIQTDTFNKWALNFTLGKLNESWELKDGRVNADSLNGNILKGIKLVKGSITIKDDTLIDFSSLEIKYDLWSLLNHKISVDYLDLNSPRINLIRQKYENDSIVWNFEKLFGTSARSETTKSPFDWDVNINTFKIENGYVRIIGNRVNDVPLWQMVDERKKEFDFNNLELSNIQLELETRYSQDIKSVNLKNLSFNTNSDFTVKKLAINSVINEKDTVSDVNFFELETGRSNIKIDKIHISGFDLLNPIIFDDFENKALEVKLNIYKLDFADLKFFIPEMNVFDSTISLKLDVNGKFNDLNITELNLKLPNSIIDLKGSVRYPDNPDSLYLNITSNQIQIYPHDVLTIYKNNSIPDYSNLGIIYANIYYKGTINEFYSEYDVKTDAGYVNGFTNLNLKNETYSGNITSHQVNLGKILKNNQLNSSLNTSAKYSGSGFDINRMSSRITYSMDNSSIANYNISSSTGEIRAEHNNFDLNVKMATSAGIAVITGRVNIANPKIPVYALKGNVKALDISKLTKNDGNRSNLNAAFDINGRGSSLNNINGRYNFLIDNSSYAQYKIPQTPLNININNTGSQGSVTVITDMAELNASGTFDMASIYNAVRYNIASLNNVISNKLNPDSIRQVSSNDVLNRNYEKNVNLNYELILKDTVKLSQFISPFGFNFNGNIKGNISNSSGEFSSVVNLNVKNFKYRDTVIVLKNVETDFSFKNNYSDNVDESFAPYSIILKTTGDRIIFGGNRIDSAKISLNMDNSLANLKASGKQDSTNFGRIAGNFDLSGNKIVANIDSVYTKYKLYRIENSDRWIINYTPGQEVFFEKFGVKSGSMVVNVNGNYSFFGYSDITVKANTTTIDAIMSAIYPVDTKNVIQTVKSPFEGEVTTLYLNYKGSMENPDIIAELNTNSLKYDGNIIGTINAKVNYKNEMLTPDIVLKNDKNKGTLIIDGNVPYKNPLMQQDSTDVSALTGPVGLRVTAQNFEIGNFAKLVPDIGDLTGVLKGEITANGTVLNPDLKGNLSLVNGTYLFPLTGMDYGFNFNISTANSKLLVDKFVLYNQTDITRHFDIFGDIDFTGLKLNNIDLTCSGDMFFLDNSVDLNELGIYGSFRGGSGNPPITIKGNLQKLNIAGQFLIKDGTISSVPLNGNGYDEHTDNFIYINSSKTAMHQLDSSIFITPDEFLRVNQFEKYKYIKTEKPASTFDFLNLDLNVKTEKNLIVSLDFNNLTRDRLFGEIQADLNIKTENKQINAYGNVDVVGDSYYTFYRDFKVKDSRITFNGPILNPILDIKAVYEGTKSSQQYGINSTIPVEVELTVKGNIDTPQVQLNLRENGTVVNGSDAQSDAITFLLFGMYKSELSTSQTQVMASSMGSQVGSFYASSYISQELRQVLPFIVNAEFNYNQGDVVQNADVAVTSQFGDATVRVGSRQINNTNYFEFMVDYPVNKLFKLNLPETLMLQLAREELPNSVVGSTEVHYSTGLKLIYKFKF